jgi:hypothetical protein
MFVAYIIIHMIFNFLKCPELQLEFIIVVHPIKGRTGKKVIFYPL